MTPSATISDCGKYRYELARSWGNGPHLRFIMLNPSTADAMQDDPTIRRCISFAKREGFDGMAVVNLFAFRATDPKVMAAADDPEGPSNLAHLREAAGIASAGDNPIVCAWGSHKMAERESPSVLQIIEDAGARAVCLGVTKSGAPRHPLYVKGDAPLIPYTGTAP